MPITLDRNLNASTDTELKAPQLISAPLLFLDFPTLAKHYAGSSTNIELTISTVMPNSIYLGVGGISSISGSEESIELKSTKINATINGLDSTYIALVLAENYYGRDATLGLATLDSNYVIIGEPVILFKGFMSILTINSQEKFSVDVEIESILADWERPRIKRYNTGTQELIDGTDKGFDNVADNITKEIVWG